MKSFPYLTDEEARFYCGCGGAHLCTRIDNLLQKLSKEREEKASMALELHRMDERLQQVLANSR